MLINDNGYFMTGSQEVVGSNPIFSTPQKAIAERSPFVLNDSPFRDAEYGVYRIAYLLHLKEHSY
jgi:hypothetical protein